MELATLVEKYLSFTELTISTETLKNSVNSTRFKEIIGNKVGIVWSDSKPRDYFSVKGFLIAKNLLMDDFQIYWT